MSHLVQRALLALGLLVTMSAYAAQAGFRTINVAGPGGVEPIVVALYYPTSANERPIALGPFSARVAPGAAPDTRVKALIILSHGNAGTEVGQTLGVVFTGKSLAEISVPTLVYEAELDRYLVPKFHAAWVAQNVRGVELRRVSNAWHYAFMDTPSMAIETVDGDVRANPPGFDRPAFLKRLDEEVPAFFDGAFRY